MSLYRIDSTISYRYIVLHFMQTLDKHLFDQTFDDISKHFYFYLLMCMLHDVTLCFVSVWLNTGNRILLVFKVFLFSNFTCTIVFYYTLKFEAFPFSDHMRQSYYITHKKLQQLYFVYRKTIRNTNESELFLLVNNLIRMLLWNFLINKISQHGRNM